MPETKQPAKRGHVSKPLLVTIIATVLLIVFIVLALLIAPTDQVPTFTLTDQNGDWQLQDQGQIGVFDNKIQPDSHGEYKFVIKNETEATLMYGFKLSEYLGNLNVDAEPFMLYRIKFDNKYIDSEDWHYVGLNYNGIEILPGSEHIMTLEWHWPFYTDGEHDENDTRIGMAAGKLSVHIFIWAEVLPEDLW